MSVDQCWVGTDFKRIVRSAKIEDFDVTTSCAYNHQRKQKVHRIQSLRKLNTPYCIGSSEVPVLQTMITEAEAGNASWNHTLMVLSQLPVARIPDWESIHFTALIGASC